jgi:hypothetical protein
MFAKPLRFDAPRPQLPVHVACCGNQDFCKAGRPLISRLFPLHKLAAKFGCKNRPELVCYGLTKLLEQAVAKVQTLPAEMQDQIARMLLVYAGDEGPMAELTPEEEADLIEAKAEVTRGELASKAEVKAVLSKNGHFNRSTRRSVMSRSDRHQEPPTSRPV